MTGKSKEHADEINHRVAYKYMGLYNDKIGIYTKKYDLKPKSCSVNPVN